MNYNTTQKETSEVFGIINDRNNQEKSFPSVKDDTPKSVKAIIGKDADAWIPAMIMVTNPSRIASHIWM